MTPSDTDTPPLTCEHNEVLAYRGDQSVSRHVALWACEECSLRFYPACPTCVDVGHRNVVHPLSQPPATPGIDVERLAEVLRKTYAVAFPKGDAESWRSDAEYVLARLALADKLAAGGET